MDEMVLIAAASRDVFDAAVNSRLMRVSRLTVGMKHAIIGSNEDRCGPQQRDVLHIGRSPLAQAPDIGSSILKLGSAPFSTLLRFVDCLQEAGAKNVTIRQLKN
jgi:hypothetical protein